jgi:hypothetical protein
LEGSFGCHAKGFVGCYVHTQLYGTLKRFLKKQLNILSLSSY